MSKHEVSENDDSLFGNGSGDDDEVFNDLEGQQKQHTHGCKEHLERHRKISIPDIVSSSQPSLEGSCTEGDQASILPDVCSPTTSPTFCPIDFNKSSHKFQEKKHSDSQNTMENSKAHQPGILRRKHTKESLVRQVSFQEEDHHLLGRLSSSSDNEDVKKKRENFHSSGYGTGESGNDSFHSQTSKDDDVFNESQDTTEDGVPNLSIFGNSSSGSENNSCNSSTDTIKSPKGISNCSNLDVDSPDSSVQTDGLPNLSVINQPVNPEPKSSLSKLGVRNPPQPMHNQTLQDTHSSALKPDPIQGPTHLITNQNAKQINHVIHQTTPDYLCASSMQQPQSRGADQGPSFQLATLEPTHNSLTEYKDIFDKYVNSGRYPSSGSSSGPNSANNISPTDKSICFKELLGDKVVFNELIKNNSESMIKLLCNIILDKSLGMEIAQGSPPPTKDQQADLEYMSKCEEYRCLDPLCKELKSKMQGLQTALENDFQFQHVKEAFKSLVEHAIHCEVPQFKCTVPFCPLLWGNREYHEDCFNELKANYCSLKVTLDDVFLDEYNSGSFITFSPGNPSITFPNQDVVALLSFGMYGNVTLFADNGADHVIKKINIESQDENCTCTEVLKHLKNKSHRNLVPHLWMYTTDKHVYVCTQFVKGGDLNEYMKKKMFLTKEEAIPLFVQLLSAASYLHSLKIIYLYWSASNMLFVNGKNHLQVSNLSMSVIEKSAYDGGYLKNCLPPSVIPPELVEDGSLEKEADSWGLGCLLAHMLTGKQMWSDYRHKYTKIFSMIKERKSPLAPDQISRLLKMPEIYQVIKDCWQLNAQVRPSTEDMRRRLTLKYDLLQKI